MDFGVRGGRAAGRESGSGAFQVIEAMRAVGVRGGALHLQILSIMRLTLSIALIAICIFSPPLIMGQESTKS